MTETKEKLDTIGLLNSHLKDIEDGLTKIAYVQNMANTYLGVVFDSQSPIAFNLPTPVVEKVVAVIKDHLTNEHAQVIDKATEYLK